MTIKDTQKLLTIIYSGYPNFHPEDPYMTVKVWQKILEPDNYEDLEAALMIYMRSDTSGFAPSPGKLHSMISSMQDPGLSEGEITSMLTFASRNANYGSEEEYNKLPKLLRRAIGSPAVIRTWGTMEAEQLKYVFGNVVKTYNKLMEEDRQIKAAVGTSLERLENVNRLDELTDALARKLRGPIPFEVEEGEDVYDS